MSTHIDGNKYLLTPLKDGSFLPDVCISDTTTSTLTDMRIEFSKIYNNELVIFHNLSNGSKQILGTKFHVEKPNKIWENRLGVYEIVEPNESDYQFLTYFELLVENGVLIFKKMEEYEGTEKYNTAISIYDDNTAFSIGIGRHRGCTLLFDNENEKEILWFSGYKLKRMEK